MKRMLLCLCIGCAAMLSFAVEEAAFETIFPQKILPWFETARVTGQLRARDGLVLRWFSIEAVPERAAMVIIPGWSEVAESFTEMLYDLRGRDLSFYVLDHRCQGLSGGEIEPRDRWHLENWENLLSDLDLFMEKVVRARPHRKVVLYGNSMGGALATTYLARHPGSAHALVMTVPMFGIKTAPMPLFTVTATMRLFMLLGKGASYVPGYGPYRREPFEGNTWSITSRARYEHLDRLNESRTEYQMGGLTACGGLELVNLSRAASTAASKVEVPSLLVQAGLDEMVRNDAQDRAAGAMGNCRVVAVEGAHHAIMNLVDEVRGQALSAIRVFLEEQTR